MWVGACGVEGGVEVAACQHHAAEDSGSLVTLRFGSRTKALVKSYREMASKNAV